MPLHNPALTALPNALHDHASELPRRRRARLAGRATRSDGGARRSRGTSSDRARRCWRSSPAPHDGRPASPPATRSALSWGARRTGRSSRGRADPDPRGGRSRGRPRRPRLPSWSVAASSRSSRRRARRAEAVSQARRFVPDLVLMDVRLPDGSGIEACRDIRAEFPTMPVVFLTSSPDDESVFAAIIAGANGYVLKQSRSDQAHGGPGRRRPRRVAARPDRHGAGPRPCPPDRDRHLCRRDDEPDAAGTEDPPAPGRRQHEQADRRRHLPLGQDGEELREPRSSPSSVSSAGHRPRRMSCATGWTTAAETG